MSWTYGTVRTTKALCDSCGEPVDKGATAYRTTPGEKPIRYRHNKPSCWGRA